MWLNCGADSGATVSDRLRENLPVRHDIALAVASPPGLVMRMAAVNASPRSSQNWYLECISALCLEYLKVGQGLASLRSPILHSRFQMGVTVPAAPRMLRYRLLAALAHARARPSTRLWLPGKLRQRLAAARIEPSIRRTEDAYAKDVS